MTVNMGQFIAPKSDQLNADDLIAGPRTITVAKVSANEGSAEQPINVFYEGDNGKPFRPCKSMRRVMVAVWGADASEYVGRSMTIYRDPSVAFGGMQVGGIRISHMSDMAEPITLALTATRAQRKPYRVLPLVKAAASEADLEAWKAEAAKGKEAFRDWWRKQSDTVKKAAHEHLPTLQRIASDADEARIKAAQDRELFGED